MRFADHVWLWGTALSLLVAVLLVLGGFAHQRAVARFGDVPLVAQLKTARTGPRRALRGFLLVTALALAFVAAAQPQYGKGTRVVPATNLDVVLVLDFSKSMYARDISPSRIDRAKAEMGELVKRLAPARFGAVAFAGSAMTFPLTSDGAAVAQFFRGLEPNDMPVGGTAIGRALETAHQLLVRDPQSPKHERVIVLVTDGEDLEGDPVQVAETIAQDRTKIHVVQIGGRAPEPIPDIDENGVMRGMRTDDNGQMLMTSLSAEGEAQLAQIASKTGGTVVRSEKGTTGIEAITSELRRVMTEELSERVETTYADVYAYPLGVALLLLMLEAFIGTSAFRKRPSETPLERKPRHKRRRTSALDGAALTVLLISFGPFLSGCSEVESAVDKVLVHHAPQVDEAIEAFGQKQTERAFELLAAYLETGACEHGVIGTPDRTRRYPDASFDLGLALFALGEQFGQKFGAEAPPAPQGQQAQQDPAEAQKTAQRRERVECALRLVLPIASNDAVPSELRARAHYLAGNLEFLRGEYKAAVTAYDAALLFDPARAKAAPSTDEKQKTSDAPDAPAAPGALGRAIAHNRAIALRRIEEQEKKDQEKKQDEQKPDENQSDEQKQSQDQKDQEKSGDQKDQQDQKPEDQKGDDQQKPEAQKGDQQKPEDQKGNDEQAQNDKSDQQKQDGSQEPGEAGKEPGQTDGQPKAPEQQGPSASQDDRLLDDLERAPTFQEQDAERNARRGRRRAVMEDK